MGYGARRYLIVVSIGISLMISDAKHFFPLRCLLAIYMSTLVKHLFGHFIQYLIGYLFFLLNCMSFCRSWISILCQIHGVHLCGFPEDSRKLVLFSSPIKYSLSFNWWLQFSYIWTYSWYMEVYYCHLALNFIASISLFSYLWIFFSLT